MKLESLTLEKFSNKQINDIGSRTVIGGKPVPTDGGSYRTGGVRTVQNGDGTTTTQHEVVLYQSDSYEGHPMTGQYTYYGETKMWL